MKQHFRLLLLILILSTSAYADSFLRPIRAPNRVFHMPACKNLTVTCFTNEGRHYVGYISVLQFPRMSHNRVVCLPYGQFVNRLLIKKIVARCDTTYPYSCKKYRGCQATLALKRRLH